MIDTATDEAMAGVDARHARAPPPLCTEEEKAVVGLGLHCSIGLQVHIVAFRSFQFPFHLFPLLFYFSYTLILV